MHSLKDTQQWHSAARWRRALITAEDGSDSVYLYIRCGFHAARRFYVFEWHAQTCGQKSALGGEHLEADRVVTKDDTVKKTTDGLTNWNNLTKISIK